MTDAQTTAQLQDCNLILLLNEDKWHVDLRNTNWTDKVIIGHAPVQFFICFSDLKTQRLLSLKWLA